MEVLCVKFFFVLLIFFVFSLSGCSYLHYAECLNIENFNEFYDNGSLYEIPENY